LIGYGDDHALIGKRPGLVFGASAFDDTEMQLLDGLTRANCGYLSF
jgi:hypothetical protein